MTDVVPAGSSGVAVPKGWYPDPANQALRKWWDGTKWTDNAQPGFYDDGQERFRWWDSERWTEIYRPSTSAMLGDFAGLVVTNRWLHYGDQVQPVAGAQVVVETAGQLQRLPTLTRAAAGGILFGPAGAIVGAIWGKKNDTRELYIMVDGSLWTWVVPVPPKLAPQARHFAAWVDSVGKQAGFRGQ